MRRSSGYGFSLPSDNDWHTEKSLRKGSFEFERQRLEHLKIRKELRDIEAQLAAEEKAEKDAARSEYVQTQVRDWQDRQFRAGKSTKQIQHELESNPPMIVIPEGHGGMPRMSAVLYDPKVTTEPVMTICRETLLKYGFYEVGNLGVLRFSTAAKNGDPITFDAVPCNLASELTVVYVEGKGKLRVLDRAFKAHELAQMLVLGCIPEQAKNAVLAAASFLSGGVNCRKGRNELRLSRR